MNGLVIEAVKVYTDELATDIGRLTRELIPGHSGRPAPEARLGALIEAEQSDLLIAKRHEETIGMATLNVVLDQYYGKSFLKYFAVSPGPDIRGRGVGFALWGKIGEWCMAMDAPELEWRFDHVLPNTAYEFYLRQGAKILGRTATSTYFSRDFRLKTG